MLYIVPVPPRFFFDPIFTEDSIYAVAVTSIYWFFPPPSDESLLVPPSSIFHCFYNNEIASRFRYSYSVPVIAILAKV